MRIIKKAEVEVKCCKCHSLIGVLETDTYTVDRDCEGMYRAFTAPEQRNKYWNCPVCQTANKMRNPYYDDPDDY